MNDKKKVLDVDPSMDLLPASAKGSIWEPIVLEEKEFVDHPDHYNAGNIEVIEALKEWGFAEDFCVGNAIKYLARYKHKHEDPDKQLEDLKKGLWYLEYVIEMLETE